VCGGAPLVDCPASDALTLVLVEALVLVKALVLALASFAIVGGQALLRRNDSGFLTIKKLLFPCTYLLLPLYDSKLPLLKRHGISYKVL